MGGWGTIKVIRALADRIDALGFEFSQCSLDCGNETRVSLKARGDCLPHYSRDAEIWIGTLEELQYWLNGVEWARDYDRMLKISDAKKRDKAESIERGRQLMQTLKQSKLVRGKRQGITAEKDWELEADYEQEDDLPF
jgi:hypothetical protein